MIRIYLDQNKWIDLARARVGHEAGRQFHAVWTEAQRAVRSHVSTFPLSAVHYMEAWNTRNTRRHWDLALTMLALAWRVGAPGPDTLAGLPEILPMEIDKALQRRFGRPAVPRECSVFGQGVRHAFGKLDYPLFKLPAGVQLSGEVKSQTERRVDHLLEIAALTDPPDGVVVPGMDRESYKRPSITYMRREQDLISHFQTIESSKELRSRYLALII